MKRKENDQKPNLQGIMCKMLIFRRVSAVARCQLTWAYWNPLESDTSTWHLPLFLTHFWCFANLHFLMATILSRLTSTFSEGLIILGPSSRSVRGFVEAAADVCGRVRNFSYHRIKGGLGGILTSWMADIDIWWMVNVGKYTIHGSYVINVSLKIN